MNRLLITAISLLSLFWSCRNCQKDTLIASHLPYNDTSYWYAYGETDKFADVFYVYPTVSTLSYAENDSSWFADITLPEVRKEANENQRFNKLLYHEYNFYAPYYRQMIFESYAQPDSILSENVAFAAQDVKEAFRHYMEHANNGRPFFLVGHSQGSQMLIELLKDGLTETQRQRMIAAYCIGYRITLDDINQHPINLSVAYDSCDFGKIVLFNSVAIPEAQSLVSLGDVAGVNPLSWTADTTYVDARYNLGMARYNDTRDSILFIPHQTGTYLYQHVTVCPDIDPKLVFIPAFEAMFPYGNLHFADSWLFGGNVKENMACRLRHWQEAQQ